MPKPTHLKIPVKTKTRRQRRRCPACGRPTWRYKDQEICVNCRRFTTRKP